METAKWPLFMLGFLCGIVIGFVLSDAMSHAQSWQQQPDGGMQWRVPNQYNSGGYSYGSAGPQWDHGVPLYQPPASVPLMFWYGAGRKVERRRQQAKQEELKAQVEQPRADACVVRDEVNDFRRIFGLPLEAPC